MIDFEKLGTIKLYEDDWSYQCNVDMKVGNGMVSVYELNIAEKEPDSLRRILKVSLRLLLETLHACPLAIMHGSILLLKILIILY